MIYVIGMRQSGNKYKQFIVRPILQTELYFKWNYSVGKSGSVVTAFLQD